MDIPALLECVDIVDYIGQYCELEERDGEWWGLSPFTDEKTPSFSVNREGKVYYDFSSGHGGNVLRFIQRYHNVSFSVAVEKAKSFANITCDVYYRRGKDLASTMRKYGAKSGNKTVVHQKLQPTTMDGYLKDWNVLKVWEDEGISREAMEFFGVRYDPFSNCIVFPVRMKDGTLINVCGRTLNVDYKAKGIRKYTYFYKLGTLDLLYGLYENFDAIVDAGEVIVFEGAKSVMLARTWGIHNTVALLTSHMNNHQMRLLLELGVRVVLALDEEVEPKDDKEICKLMRYLTIEAVRNRDGLLQAKMAPVDAGVDVWTELYRRREPLS